MSMVITHAGEQLHSGAGSTATGPERAPARSAAQTLVSVLRARAEQHPDRVALRFLGDDGLPVETLSYAELHRTCVARAAALRRHASTGDRALLLYPSGSEYVKAFLACSYAGIVAVPAYPPVSADPKHLGRVLAIAGDARPRLVLTDSASLPALQAAQAAVPALAEPALLATDTQATHAEGAIEAAGDLSWTDVGPDDLALLQYTSGSTALPRGVEVSHGNLMANERAISAAFGMDEQDVVVSWLPLFHDMGLIGTLLQPLYAGASSVLMSHQQFLLHPHRWLEAISRFRGTVSGAPDFAYRLCVQRVAPEVVRALDLSSWRLAFCGAEPVRASTLEAFVDRFTPAGFAAKALYPCYGLAEATLLVTGAEPSSGMEARCFRVEELARGQAVELERGCGGDGAGRVLVSCGTVRPGHEIRIVHVETGERLPQGAVGEIQVRGPSVARGYFGNRGATEATFVHEAEGVFLRTGDLGFLQQGALFVTGRSKDVLIVRGRNLYPQDIESSVEEHVSVVRKGRVVAFSFDSKGEERIGLAAEISRASQKLIQPAAVCEAIAECVGRQHGEALGVVVLLDQGQVPVTSSGKLQRRACRAAWQSGELKLLTTWAPA